MPTLTEWLARSTLQNTLFHFTDTRNLDSIRQHGLLSVERLHALGIVPPAPGGNQWSRDADHRVGMHRYVHLCFLKEHPMEFRAKEDGRISTSVFIPVSPRVLTLPGVLFTDKVANEANVTPMPLDLSEQYLDLEVIYNRTDWRNPEIRARRNIAKKYEVLVPDSVAVNLINLANG